MKNYILFLCLPFLFGCTVLNRKVDLYSNHLNVESTKTSVWKTKEKGPKVKKRFCNHMALLIPFSNKNPFDVIDLLIDENEKYNGLIDLSIKVDFFSIAPIYMNVCHTVEGQLIKIK